MAIDNKFTRVEADDPTRCQAVCKSGQCPYKAVDKSKYCPMHGGNKQQEKNRAESLRNYQLAKWQARVNEFADNDQVKSLREEIGITRMILETIIQSCEGPTDLLIHSTKISDLVGKVEKLVGSCHRLEAATGALLDKSAILNLASQFIQIISNHITDEDTIDRISNEFLLAVANANSERESVKRKADAAD